MSYTRRQIRKVKRLLMDESDLAAEKKLGQHADWVPGPYYRGAQLHEAMVYFVQIADQPTSPIKIGYSTCLDTRFSGLQMSCPFKLKMLGAMVGGPETEARLHESFAHALVHGEWYRPTEGLAALIDGLPKLDLPE